MRLLTKTATKNAEKTRPTSLMVSVSSRAMREDIVAEKMAMTVLAPKRSSIESSFQEHSVTCASVLKEPNRYQLL